jgi:hypothetical protein
MVSLQRNVMKTMAGYHLGILGGRGKWLAVKETGYPGNRSAW